MPGLAPLDARPQLATSLLLAGLKPGDNRLQGVDMEAASINWGSLKRAVGLLWRALGLIEGRFSDDPCENYMELCFQRAVQNRERPTCGLLHIVYEISYMYVILSYHIHFTK